MNAVGLVIVSFTSGMLTARSFAARNGYPINADQEMRAIGFSNIASGLTGGFAVTGADSRTAVNDASGGKTQLVSVVAALATAGVALFLAEPLGYLPIAALAAVLIHSAWGLLDFASYRNLRLIDRFEFGLSLLTTVGVLGDRRAARRGDRHPDGPGQCAGEDLSPG
jgi:MFS superfamily sulfate permease-like transporter